MARSALYIPELILTCCLGDTKANSGMRSESTQLRKDVAYEATFEQDGGCGDFKCQLAKYDDQGDPTISPTEAQSAVANRKLIAIVGPAFSGATAAAEPYYSKAHVATVSPSATRVTLASSGWNNFFRVVADDGVQGPADADYLVKTKGNKSVYVVSDGSSYGTGLATAFAGQASADGAKVTSVTVPGTAQCTDGTASATEYSAAATQAVASGAKAMFYGGYYCDLGLFLGALGS